MGADPRQRIAHLELDERTIVRRTQDIEHERAVAIYDLLEENTFIPWLLDNQEAGPYDLHLGIAENRLALVIKCVNGRGEMKVQVPLSPFRSLIKDYFLVCESYYTAIKRSSPSQIEALDMGRRALHNDGATLLITRLEGKIGLDKNTARRLFTLICVLHLRG